MEEDSKFTKTKQMANRIVDLFEDLLSEHNISIPNNNREGEEQEACIFGDDYYSLEDGVIEKIREIKKDMLHLCEDNDIMKRAIENYFEEEV